MSKVNKYFVFSDVHGEYDALMSSLTEAGFSINDPNHILISCGDNFDRGPRSKELYSYFSQLKRQGRFIGVKGNHDAMFLEYLEKGMDGEFVLFNILHNGLGETLRSFLGLADGNMNVNSLSEMRYKLDSVKSFVKSLPLYYETKHFIFCHAGINPQMIPWQNTSEDYMLWDVQDSHLACPNTNKFVVIGHHHAARVRRNAEMKGIGESNPNEVNYRVNGELKGIHFYGNTDENRPYICMNKIALDGMTNVTKKVNIMVIEDEPKEDKAEEPVSTDEYIVNADGIMSHMHNPFNMYTTVTATEGTTVRTNFYDYYN